VQRYFASDFDGSDYVFEASEIAVVEVVDAGMQQRAVLHALSRCSNAVLAQGEIDAGEMQEEARIGLTS